MGRTSSPCSFSPASSGHRLRRSGRNRTVIVMDSESLGIRIFTETPSTVEFECHVESKNIPAVFRGCVNEWEAYRKWNPSEGGLDYLEERIGSLKVEAMLSRAAPVFYGDLRSHERVCLPFSTFSKFFKELRGNKAGNCQVRDEPKGQDSEQSDLELSSLLPDGASPHQMYLAQVPIMNVENQEKVQLDVLKNDIQVPRFLEKKILSSVNFWMNGYHARSSTHYDPHHNLLCVVAGRKKVLLWPPSVSPMLYPMPIYGEASNHSSVALQNPDLSVYPKAGHLMDYAQSTVLYPGDALFIPEGWFHQIDSDELTMAVNIWWQSDIMSSMLLHMDSYYLRQIVRRLTEREKTLALPRTTSNLSKLLPEHNHEERHKGRIADDSSNHTMDQHSEGRQLGEAKQQQVLPHELEPFSLQALHELVSQVHHHMDVLDPRKIAQHSLTNNSECSTKYGGDRLKKPEIFCMDDDPVAKTLWSLDPLAFQKVLLAMARDLCPWSMNQLVWDYSGCEFRNEKNFPRTLEALVFHLLSPVAAEVLTQKFDEMDRHMNELKNSFYENFYAAFDDPYAAMDAILCRKESFARQAFKNVLKNYLAVNLDLSRPELG